MKSWTAILALGVCLGLLGCGGVSSKSDTVGSNPPPPPPPPTGGEVTPNYFSSDFQTPYKAFIQQVVQHYGNNPSIGYIRFGLAQGGETYPNLGFDTDPTCSDAFTAWGWTPTSWTNYLTSMLDYEATLNSPKQLMVGINTVNMDTSIPDAVAAEAVSLTPKIGFGSQGLQQSDISAFSAGTACTADWCNLFDTYSGQIPLELQTATQSDPTGSGTTGSLVTLLPFAVERHATIVELYYQDWLTGFDSSYPGYDASYAAAIQSVAGDVQVEILHPPSSTSGTYASGVQSLMTNPAVAGANFYIEWAKVDQGPTVSPQYDWSSIDSTIQPWITAGKTVNLIVWAVADSATNTSTPAYVLANLGAANTTTCNNGTGQ